MNRREFNKGAIGSVIGLLCGKAVGGGSMVCIPLDRYPRFKSAVVPGKALSEMDMSQLFKDMKVEAIKNNNQSIAEYWQLEVTGIDKASRTITVSPR